jgi:hypothetical protein
VDTFVDTVRLELGSGCGDLNATPFNACTNALIGYRAMCVVLNEDRTRRRRHMALFRMANVGVVYAWLISFI